MAEVSTQEVAQVLKFIARFGYDTVERALEDIEVNIMQAMVDKALNYENDPEYLQAMQELESTAEYDGKVKRRRFQPVERDQVAKLLPHCWSQREADELIQHFGGCALSDATTGIELDHFIPVSWGHGGTYIGNIVPLSKELNRLKDNRNPFDWIQDPKVRRLIQPKKWAALLEYLADKHKVTVQEFEQYVSWCSAYQRAATDGIKFSSFELWKSQPSS